MTPKPTPSLAAPAAGLLALFALPAGAQVADFSVGPSGTHATIQAAVDACPGTGCTITLTEDSYPLIRELWIEGKQNLTLRASDDLKAKGVRPRIFTPTNLFETAGTAANPTDPERPAGWKKWPNTCTTTPGGSKNTTNPYSLTGYMHNGLVVVKASSEVVLDGLLLDGTTPSLFRNVGIWNCMYDIVHGNVGLNLYQSRHVTLRGSDVRNFFSALYINGRNVDGQYAVHNPSDLDIAVPWGTRPGTSGDHLIEANQFTSNFWVVYDESEWDMASTFRFNKALDNRNPAYASILSSGEGANMAGGFLYAKDVVHNPHRIHNNTIWGSPLILGSGAWRAGAQHLFYNNLVGGFDRFAKDAALSAMVGNFRQLLGKHSLWMDNNLFETSNTTFATQTFTQGQIADQAACTAAGLTSPCYVTWDTPVTVNMVLPGDWLWNGWRIQGNGTYTGVHKGVTYTTTSGPNIEIFPGGGFIVKSMGLSTTFQDISAARNRWVKSLPFVSLEPGTDGFLVPDWNSTLVKTAVKDQGRQFSGATSSLDIGAATFSGTLPRIHGLKSQRLPHLSGSGCWDLPIQTDPEAASTRITAISAWNVPYADGTPGPAVARTISPLADSSLSDGTLLHLCAGGTLPADADIRFQLETSATLKDGTPVAQEPAFYQIAATAKTPVGTPSRAVSAAFAPALRRTAQGLELSGLDAGAARVTVRTLDGRVVRSLDAVPVAGSFALSRSILPKGTLLIQVRQGQDAWQTLTSAL